MMKSNFINYIPLLVFFLFSKNFQGQVAVNEIMSTNLNVLADEDGDYNDWIEIYNYGTTTIDLTGYGLSDAAATPYKWIFPGVTIAPNQYLLIWASDKNRTVVGQPLHTNFKIGAGGEPISLTSPDGNSSNIAPSIALSNNVSYGRQPDGTGSWLYFYTSTPGFSNTGTGLTELLNPPVFSHNSGLYSQNFNLSLSHPNPNATIVYTLDGSEPNINNLSGTSFHYKNAYKLEPTDVVGPLLTDSYISKTYTSPIAISDNSSQPNKLSNKNTRQDPLYVPTNPVRKGNVVRARAYVNGVPSEIISKTFFVWSGGNPYQLPVISLQIQEDKLFDYQNGIYTAGKDFDDWRAANPDSNQWYRPEWCNYWRSGDLWEFPTNFEYFAAGSLTPILNIKSGFRIHGNNSRANAIKSLRLYARSDYNDIDVFEHQFFDEKIPNAVNPTNNLYKRLMLRAEGSGGPVAYDVVFNRAMQPFFNGITRIKPAIHFINGEYWGITALRDRMDKYHYVNNFGLNADDVIQIECTGSNCNLDEGTNTDYQSFIDFQNFIIMNNMADNNNYQQVVNQMDIDSFIDHILIEIFAANDSYERTFWKSRTTGTSPYADGKWRLMVKDFESSLKTNTNWLQYWANNISPTESFLNHLLDNADFKNKFITRFADLLNSAFTTTRFQNIVNTTFNEVAPYLVEDTNRFPRLNFYTNINKQDLLDWGSTRPNIQREQIRNYFNITNNIDIQLNISNNSAGIIKINTLKIDSETPGINPNPYPWTGVYFNGIPITLQAIAKDGYVFSHWSGDISGTNPSITFTPTANMSITANYSPIPVPDQVVYFWMMDSSIPNDTPLTTLNSTYANNSLSAAVNYISCLTGYPFNSAHASWRKASLERKNVPTPLNYHPEANNNQAYVSGNMRGLQIKQPFRNGSNENMMEFNLPTTGLFDVKFSLAIKSDGAAETLIMEYWDGNQWTNTGVANNQTTIGVDFSVKNFDFTPIVFANNNPTFKIRLRFDGADMISDTGKAVHLNNIALEGKSAALGTHNVSNKEIFLKVFPNPAHNFANIISSEIIKNLVLYNSLGQKINEKNPEKSEDTINLEKLEPGVYFLKIKTADKEKTLKLIKN